MRAERQRGRRTCRRPDRDRPRHSPTERPSRRWRGPPRPTDRAAAKWKTTGHGMAPARSMHRGKAGAVVDCGALDAAFRCRLERMCAALADAEGAEAAIDLVEVAERTEERAQRLPGAARKVGRQHDIAFLGKELGERPGGLAVAVIFVEKKDARTRAARRHGRSRHGPCRCRCRYRSSGTPFLEPPGPVRAAGQRGCTGRFRV